MWATVEGLKASVLVIVVGTFCRRGRYVGSFCGVILFEGGAFMSIGSLVFVVMFSSKNVLWRLFNNDKTSQMKSSDQFMRHANQM